MLARTPPSRRRCVFFTPLGWCAAFLFALTLTLLSIAVVDVLAAWADKL